MIKVITLAILTFYMQETVFCQNLKVISKGNKDDATFVTDVTIPDGTVMSPGQRFTKTWRIRNSGSTVWENYKLVFADGSQMDAPSSVLVPSTLPGATVDISVAMTAPRDADQYRGNWEIRTADGKLFGNYVFVLIRVKSSMYKGKSFDDWKKDLQAPTKDVRRKAIEALSGFGPEAATSIIESFRSDRDETNRTLALSALADIKPLTNEAIKILFDATIDPNPTVSAIATMIVYEALPSLISPESISALVEAMRDPSPFKRQLAIQLLASLGPVAKDVAPILKKIANDDPKPRIRSIAKKALARIERRGVVSNNIYTSARNWFSVQVPQSANWANVPFTIEDSSENGPTERDDDRVTFSVDDFGEILVTGVGKIPNGTVNDVNEDDNRSMLSIFADVALSKWREIRIKPNIFEESLADTRHGKSLLRVYKAEKASLLSRSSGHKPMTTDRFNVFIAVIVAKVKNHYIYAIAENDAEGISTNNNLETLKKNVRSFFENVDVHI